MEKLRHRILRTINGWTQKRGEEQLPRKDEVRCSFACGNMCWRSHETNTKSTKVVYIFCVKNFLFQLLGVDKARASSTKYMQILFVRRQSLSILQLSNHIGHIENPHKRSGAPKLLAYDYDGLWVNKRCHLGMSYTMLARCPIFYGCLLIKNTFCLTQTCARTQAISFYSIFPWDFPGRFTCSLVGVDPLDFWPVLLTENQWGKLKCQ